MDVNGQPINNSGITFENDNESVLLPSSKRLRPNTDLNSDLGTSSQRFQNIYYQNLIPAPGGGSGGPFLALDGSTTMGGNVVVGGNNVTGVTNLNSLPVANLVSSNSVGTSSHGHLAVFYDSTGTTVFDNNIISGNLVSNPLTAVIGNVPYFTNTAGLIIEDSLVPYVNIVQDSGTATSGNVTTYTGNKAVHDSGTALSALLTVAGAQSAYVQKSGSTMTGSLNLGTNALNNLGSLSGATNSRTADNIISCATNGVSGDIATFTGTAKVIQDSGVLLSSLATTSSLASYLPLGGGTMSGPINMGGANIVGGALISGPTYQRTIDNIISCVSTGVSGDIATFTGTAKVIQDSGVLLSSLLTSATAATTYLALAGGTMSGAIAMGTNNITNIGSLSGATNTRTADNIISCTTNGVSGDIATFTGTAKLIQDSGVLLSSLLTSATAATTYLALSGGTMSGGIIMGSHSITGISNQSVLTPSCINTYAGTTSVALTASTALAVAATTSSTNSPNGDFTLNTSTGQLTYVGSATRWFNIYIPFGVQGQSAAATISAWVSKQGSTTPVNYHNISFIVGTLTNYVSSFAQGIVQLAQNQTIQLMLQSTATITLSLSDIQYIVTSCQ